MNYMRKLPSWIISCYGVTSTLGFYEMRALFHETKHEKFRGALIKLDSKLSKQT